MDEEQRRHDLALACGLLPNKNEELMIISWNQLLRLIREIRRQRDQALDELKVIYNEK